MLISCLLMAALGDGTRADELRLAQYYGPDYPPPGYGYPPPCQAVTRVLCGAPRWCSQRCGRRRDLWQCRSRCRDRHWNGRHRRGFPTWRRPRLWRLLLKRGGPKASCRLVLVQGHNKLPLQYGSGQKGTAAFEETLRTSPLGRRSHAAVRRR